MIPSWVRLIPPLVLTVVKRRLAYRGDLILATLDELLRGLLALAMLEVYVARTPDLAGWDRWQLLFILGFSLVPVSLFHAFCGNLYQLSGHYLIGGHFDRVLLRPAPTFLQVCLDRIAIEDLSGAILGVLVMVTAASHLPAFPWDPLHLGLLLVMQASAFAIVVAVFMAFAATGFWFEDRVGMVPPVYNLMEFGRWPASIYHPALKALITCVIPFSFVAFYPASLFVGGADLWPALATPLVAVVALLTAMTCWRAGVARYGSAGS
jgi:ABC-2 type transport system permease protein